MISNHVNHSMLFTILYSCLGAYTIQISHPTIIIKKVIWIIIYQPFWETIKKKEISTYKLIEDYKLSRSLIDKLKHNKGINTSTLNQLCIILDCQLTDIVEFRPDKE